MTGSGESLAELLGLSDDLKPTVGTDWQQTKALYDIIT
jgi:hypothetical protein